MLKNIKSLHVTHQYHIGKEYERSLIRLKNKRIKL